MTRAQLIACIDSKITDELERQNTAAVVRDVLYKLVLHLFNLAEDDLNINQVEGLGDTLSQLSGVPTAPVLSIDDEANTISAAHYLGASEIVVSANGGLFEAYTGTIQVGNVARPAGYYVFKTRAATGRKESLLASSPAFTLFGTAPVNKETPAAPFLIADDEANTLTASHSLGASEILVSTNGGAFTEYTGTINVGNNARPYGYWLFKTKASATRNESAATPSPAFTVAQVQNTTPAAPILNADDTANTLSASHSLGASEILVSENGGAFLGYAGTIQVGNLARPAGYWQFKIKSAAGRNESAIVNSPAFTLVTVTLPVQMIFEGDSTTAAFNGIQPYPSQLQPLLGAGYGDFFNAGTSGQRIEVMAADAASQIKGRYDFSAFSEARVFLLAGINNFGHDGASLETVQAGVMQFITNAKDAKAKIYLITLPASQWPYPSPLTPAQIQARVNDYNQWIRANYAVIGATGFIDSARDTRLQNPNDTTYFSDKLHFTNAGALVVAQNVAGYIQTGAQPTGSILTNPTNPTNTAPSVTLAVNKTSITTSEAIVLTATASDSDGTISKVEFYSGANKMGEKTAAPYTHEIPAGYAPGQYTYTAKAYGNLGAVTTSGAVTVNATGGTSGPTYNRTITTGQEQEGVTLQALEGVQFKFNAPQPAGTPAPTSMAVFVGGTPIAEVYFNIPYVGQVCAIVYNGQTYHRTFASGTLNL